MVGYAQSNARVSTLMRSIDDSPWLDSPVLREIRSATANGTRTNEFSLGFNLTKQNAPAVVDATPPKPGAKG
jgi:type IV pilus assembly protein PilN